MGTYNSAVITTAGQSLLARTLADSLPFYFTSAKTTEYVVPSGTSAASLTELPNIKQSEEITSATVTSSTQVTTSVRFSNDDITLNYSINTIGVYAKAGTDADETLIAVITAQTADVMPSYSATNPVAYVYSINLAISNAANINIVVSPTGTVSYAEFSDLEERVNEIIERGSGLSTDAKVALLNCFQKVAWIDDDGQTYYDTLYNALFPSAVSISATFTPGGHVFYDTDSLDALRPYLIVRATMPDSTVKIVTDYILTGSMAVGTNTITVRYQGLTDTFEVTTVANPAYIDAVFTQPSTTIYTDDALDTLKSNLVVTYYSAPGATGTVLADSAYTLVGTLTEGTSTVFVSYSGLTTSFTIDGVVDFYNIQEWNFPGNLVKVQGGAVSFIDSSNSTPGISKANPSSVARNTVVVERGLSGMEPLHWENNGSDLGRSDYYLVPVPVGYNTVTFECNPSSYYASVRIWHYNGNNSWTRKYETGWKTGSYTWDFSENLTEGDTGYYVSVNIKFNSSGSAGDDVDGFNMTFERSDN